MEEIIERFKDRLQLLGLQLLCFLNSKPGRNFICRTLAGIAVAVIANILLAAVRYAPIWGASLFTEEQTSLGLIQIFLQYGLSRKELVTILQIAEFAIHGRAFIRWASRR